MTTLRKGDDPNKIELLVEDVQIKPYAELRRGVIDVGVIVSLNRYNLDNLLCQMLEDYGEEVLINRIKSLE